MKHVELEIQDAVARITLQRPEKLNALSPDMLSELEDIAARVERSSAVRVAILTGAGTRAFSVGADIRAWAALAPLDMWRVWIREGHRVMHRLAQLRVPLVAAINGFALGGGLELALTADLRIAADTAELAMPEVSIGTIPGWGGTTRLPAAVGMARAKEMIFSGRRIDAGTAERWGLVNSVVPADRLQEEADALAGRIAAQAPIAVQMAKQCVDQGPHEALAGALAATTDDGREGVDSFFERRPATFHGR